jgi:heme exporter protein C
MHRFANPARFLRIAAMVLPWAALATAGLFAAGLYYALWASPVDYQQGQTVRIMYVHVPAAWMALFVYTAMAVSAAAALVWKHPLADLWAKACAPIGAGFTALCLLTGMLWGEPMWGTWWVWDARLTSVLVLFFLYLGYIALTGAFDDPERGLKAGNILLLVGVVNVPIVKFSVDWWNTLHQPASISRMDAPAIHPDMLRPLLLMWAAYMGFFLVVAILRLRSEVLERRLTVLRMAQAREPQQRVVAG